MLSSSLVHAVVQSCPPSARRTGTAALGRSGLVGLFVFLGENWHVVEEYAGVFQKIVIVVVAALVAWFLVTRIRSIRRDRAAA